MKNKQSITLNADVGEGCDDALIMPYLDCANIACAAHAGDENVIRETLALAKEYDVIVGAHPGYPDKANFGRVSLSLSLEALKETLSQQIHLLLNIASDAKVDVAYVKPHGALNHDMLAKPEIFEIICKVISDTHVPLALMVPTNQRMPQQIKVAKNYGLTIWPEVFADRAYETSGLLRSRQFPDAVHANSDKIIEQLQGIRERQEIITVDGTMLNVDGAKTICIHGDHQPSVDAVRKLFKAN